MDIILGMARCVQCYRVKLALKLAPVQENAVQLLQRYWVLEEVPGDAIFLSAEEHRAVSHFEETHSRDST